MTKKYNILLVEDYEALVDEIKKHLSRDPKYNLLLAEDGVKALEIIKQNQTVLGNKIACIILDLSMPNLDGIEVLRELNLKKKTAKIPVILYSTYDYDRRILNKISKYLTGFIFKSSIIPELFPMLDKICVEKDFEWVKKDLATKLIGRKSDPYKLFDKKTPDELTNLSDITGF